MSEAVAFFAGVLVGILFACGYIIDRLAGQAIDALERRLHQSEPPEEGTTR